MEKCTLQETMTHICGTIVIKYCEKHLNKITFQNIFGARDFNHDVNFIVRKALNDMYQKRQYKIHIA